MKQTEIIPNLKSWLCSSLLLCSMLLFSYPPALAGDYVLYLPSQADTAVPPLPGAGVLVKKITITKGDTLSGLSRQYSGKASYFPQILLFNEIRNPNLIYAGKELLVPISATHKQSALRLPASVAPAKPSGSSRALRHKIARSSNSGKKLVRSAERNLYEQSAALFAEGKYREALDGFSRFLREYPSSPLAPDATLYRGDCFLRLSEI